MLLVMIWGRPGPDQSVLLAALYRKGLIYLDVPIADDDCIIGKPLLLTTF